ncbi:MAG: sugar ABC transporter ATP-binding protein [Fimbriimonas sp.]|nr:sugar ABC transporter ATP-binding protein [Fimbriimonas sp.]
MQNISKRFGATVALDNVNLQVERGEVHALVGENGSGKSTLMRVLSGAIHPDSGSITFDGKPYAPHNPMEARRLGIAMIYQELALCPHLSTAENVLLGMEMQQFGVIDRKASRRTTEDALRMLGIVGLNVDAPISSLPIATRQLVEIARAVALDSKIVVLDEPTSSLTQADVEKLFEVVNILKEKGTAIIYISHFLDEIKRICDQMTVLRDGVNVGESKVGAVDTDMIVSMMVGRKIDTIYPRSERHPGEVVLKVEGLHGARKPEDASLELRKGEVVGIAGLNGSGRTELARCIFGLDVVKSGRIRVGTIEGTAKPAKRWSEGVGMLSEDRKLEGLAISMTIADNMTMTKLPPIVSSQKQSEDSHTWIAKMGVKCRGPQQIVGELSGGNQQKVAIARLLYHDVDVMLLDEPTRGIDVGSKETIYQLIDQLALQGKAVLMISSYLPELLGVCDRIAVMHKGLLGETKAVHETGAEEIIREAAGA